MELEILGVACVYVVSEVMVDGVDIAATQSCEVVLDLKCNFSLCKSKKISLKFSPQDLRVRE